MSTFDYGKRVPENYNQYERHKHLPLSDSRRAARKFALPVRNVYIHKSGVGCGRATQMGMDIAETFAIDPKFYGRTFCCQCREYLPLAEFIWWDGGQNLDTAAFPNQYPPGWQAARDLSKDWHTPVETPVETAKDGKATPEPGPATGETQDGQQVESHEQAAMRIQDAGDEYR